MRRTVLTLKLLLTPARVGRRWRRQTGVRAPADVQNLLNVWGVEQERAKEAITVTPRSVMVNERMRRTSYRGVIDVVEGGERSINTATEQEGQTKAENSRIAINGNAKKAKRNIDDTEQEQVTTTPPMSKRQAFLIGTYYITDWSRSRSSNGRPSFQAVEPVVRQ